MLLYKLLHCIYSIHLRLNILENIVYVLIYYELIFNRKIINSMRKAQNQARYRSQSSIPESVQLTTVDDESEGEKLVYK